MKDEERKLINDFILDRITENEFKDKFSVDIEEKPDYIKELLISAYNEKNSDDIYFIINLVSYFKLINETYIEIFCKLLNSHSHYMHEDIARQLQLLKAEKAIEVLYQTALTKFEYLEYDNSYVLARKCMWALGDIGTDKAIEKLRFLANVDDEELREYAMEQFNRECLSKYILRKD